MHKKELRKLKRIYATDLMVKLARNNRVETPLEYHGYYKTKCKKSTRYDMFIRCQTRGKILMIGLFFPTDMAAGVREPLYEIYINPEGNEYITRINSQQKQNEKWSTAKMLNLGYVFAETELPNSYYFTREESGSRIWQNQEGKRTIKQFLGTKKGGWEGIVEWQESAKREQIRQQEERQQKPWDADMALVPEILPGFERWAVHDVAPEHFIFYDYVRGGAKTGYCSYCEKQVPIEKPFHGKESKCVCCKRKVTMKTSKKIQTLKTDEYLAECIQKIKGGFVIRTFRVNTWYRDRTPDNPHVQMFETDRYICLSNSGRSTHYIWGSYKNKCHRWILGEKSYTDYSWWYKRFLYTRNLNSLKKSVLKQSAIDLWGDKMRYTASKYLFVEAGNPAIEKLAKIGMFSLAAEFIDARYEHKLLNQSATELAKMLQIDNARLKRLKQMDGNIECLKWLQYEKQADTHWPDDMISDFGKAEITSLNLSFLNMPAHYVRIWNYLKKQSALSGDDLKQVLSTWKDYVNMAEKAKWNIKAEQILFPKNLDEAHGKVILFLKGNDMKNEAEKLDKQWPKVKDVLPSLHKFEYATEEYSIVTPKEMLDIVKEGTALNHCVHTCDYYFDRMQKNESYLFFLRKSSTPDTPWYTLEVEPSGNIRQKRTTGDNQNADFQKAVPFLKEWQKVFQSRLTAEEKKLGILADKARIKEYKKLRKNGNRVWHGKLAGQFLADVLEADFMAAE